RAVPPDQPRPRRAASRPRASTKGPGRPALPRRPDCSKGRHVMALPLQRGLVAFAVAAGAGAILLTGPAAGYATTGSVIGTVDSPIPLKERVAATTQSALVGTLRSGNRAAVACQVTGQWIHGAVRVTNVWDRLADGRYVSDAYVRRSGKVRVPPCAAATGAAAPVAAPVAAPPPGVVGAWVAPVPGRPGQGFRPPNNPN